MTNDMGPHCTLLDELDARQNDALRQLDELNHRIELLLHEFTKPSRDQAFSAKEKAA